MTDDSERQEYKQALSLKRLGKCYVSLGRFEEGLKCFQKAMEKVYDRCQPALAGILNEWCGYCCRFMEGCDQEGIMFYEKVKEFAQNAGERNQEYRSNEAIGYIFSKTGNYDQAKKYYKEAMKVATELDDTHCEGISCLNFADVCCKGGDDEKAVKLYEKARHILDSELNDHILQEKALAGLAVSWFNLGNTRKAMESIEKAREFANRAEQETGNHIY